MDTEKIIELLNSMPRVEVMNPNFLLTIRKDMTNKDLANYLNMNERNTGNLVRKADNYQKEKWSLKRNNSTPLNSCYLQHDKIINLASQNFRKKEIAKVLNIPYQTFLDYTAKYDIKGIWTH